MAVTAFISRVKAASIGPSAADLGMDRMNGNMGMPPLMPQFPVSIQNETSLDPGSLYLHPDKAQEFLKSIYKPLKRHYDWFRRTQRGQIKQYSRKARSRTEAYRWRGRSEHHVLTSGMDDYPRGPPHAGELHLDLISWMAFFTRTMKDISSYVGEKDDEKTFGEIETAILNNIDGKLSLLVIFIPE
jgi:mannosyl-oligosaccharide glucosidase